MLPSTLLTTSTGHSILVELKSGETYNGKLTDCDAWMNVNLKGVVCTSPSGDSFLKMDQIFIRGNTIKYVRIPDEIVDIVANKEGRRSRPEDENNNNYNNDNKSRGNRDNQFRNNVRRGGRGASRGGNGGRGGYKANSRGGRGGSRN